MEGAEMAQGSSSAAMIAAAAILGGSFIAGAYLISSSVDRGADGITNLKSAIQTAATARPAAPAAPAAPPTRSRRPDPNQVYAINVGNAPFRGSKSAAVTIVEWSDFQ